MTKSRFPALVLTGGGARAAYQIGVLKAISTQFPGIEHPFKVIVGTSAGAINALCLAGIQGQFRHGIDHLEEVWSNIHPDQVYRADMLGLSGSMTRFVRGALTGEPGTQGAAMLDNTPLHGFLTELIDFGAVQAAVREEKLQAVGVNACSYDTGRNVCFFEGQPHHAAWNHRQRSGIPAKLTLEHVLASSAIPTIFPPVKLDNEFYGDGVTRQMAHLSPAIRLGATSLLAIGLNTSRELRARQLDDRSMPNMGQIMENVLNGMFLDTLEYDIERLELINQFLEEVPVKSRSRLPAGYRELPILEISPSIPIHELARKYLSRLPTLIRRALGRNLEKGEGGVSIASYLLFDRDFCRDLIRLGYSDAQAKAKELQDFFQ